MAGTPRLLVAPVAGTGANQTLYTAPTNIKGVIRLICVANTTGSAITYSLGINGTAATVANCFVSGKSLAANTTDYVYGPFVFKAADTLTAIGSVAGVTFSAQGDEQVQTL